MNSKDKADLTVSALQQLNERLNQGDFEDEVALLIFEDSDIYLSEICPKLAVHQGPPICAPFVEYDTYVKIAKDLISIYDNKCSYLTKEIQKVCVHREYDNGKCLLERGFYCPSMFIDVFVGGYGTRGLCKRKYSKSKEYKEYLFDKNNKLHCVISHFNDAPDIIEFIFRHSGLVVGICYDCSNEISNITITQYENARLVESASFGVSDEKIYLYTIECYRYLDDLVEVYWSELPRYKIYNHFSVQLKEGKMVSYDEETFYDNVKIKSVERFFLDEKKRRNVTEFENTVNKVYVE